MPRSRSVRIELRISESGGIIASRKQKALNFSLPVSKQLWQRNGACQQSHPASYVTVSIPPPFGAGPVRKTRSNCFYALIYSSSVFQAGIRRAKFRFPLLRLSLPLASRPRESRLCCFASLREPREARCNQPTWYRLACFDGFALLGCIGTATYFSTAPGFDEGEIYWRLFELLFFHNRCRSVLWSGADLFNVKDVRFTVFLRWECEITASMKDFWCLFFCLILRLSIWYFRLFSLFWHWISSRYVIVLAPGDIFCVLSFKWVMYGLELIPQQCALSVKTLVLS